MMSSLAGVAVSFDEYRPVAAFVHMPCAVAVDEGGLHRFVVHAVLGEPIVDGIGLLEPAVQGFRVDPPVVEVHDALKLTLGRHADVVCLLQRRTDEERSFHVVAAAADNRVLFENDGLESRIRGRNARRETARAGSHDHNVGFDRTVRSECTARHGENRESGNRVLEVCHGVPPRVWLCHCAASFVSAPFCRREFVF